MKKNEIVLVLNLCLLSLCVCAQKKKPIMETEIQEIQLNNQYVVDAIRDFIKKAEDENQLFKNGFGFIVLENIKLHDYQSLITTDTNSIRNPETIQRLKDVLFSFELRLNSYFLGNDESDCFNCNYYPPFYTLIDNRLVLIYLENFSWIIQGNKIQNFSVSSIEKISKLTENTLKRVYDENFVFFDPFTKEKFKISKDKRDSLKKYELLTKASWMLDFAWGVKVLRSGAVEKIPY